MSPCTENSFEFKNSETFRNSVQKFTFKFKNANGMFQRNSNDLFIVLLITKYNIMQDIDNKNPTLDENRQIVSDRLIPISANFVSQILPQTVQ
ncbi:hypothetical protein T10_2975 [Trichinella papuae]|uniref:Uncharacterized protein n=1 Tax=Trichinella papuae TaxID=268474 RepID=A0A0V1MQ12_9BILA|nr:hypothetical protein T10_2975 [Trichinella papuae]